MKRYAAHYLYLPGYGFLKQFVVEVHADHICSLFPFSAEIEDTEWWPGVIALVRSAEEAEHLSFKTKEMIGKVPAELSDSLAQLLPVLFYPFDFISMSSVSETQRILLK